MIESLYSCQVLYNETIKFDQHNSSESRASCLDQFKEHHPTGLVCNAVYDNWTCWPPTNAGCLVRQLCPKVLNTIHTEYAFRICHPNGSWDYNNKTEKIGIGFTYYNNCTPEYLRRILDMCELIGSDTCIKVAHNIRTLELVGLSLSASSLIVSLFIFLLYRVLKNNRTRIHMHLFIAIILQVLARLVKYSTEDLITKQTDSNLYILVPTVTLLEYAKTAMFIWMFIEGLYLHNMITVTVFQEYSYVKLYFYVGWFTPALLTAIWLTVMLITVEKDPWNFYSIIPQYWILEGPRTAVIVVNLLFLLNIIRVLIMKLRESQMSEVVKVRKAVRAAIFLLPLMGIANLLFLVDYTSFQKAWQFILWSYTSYFFNTFQGLFVSIFYCFLNGEVKTALRNSVYIRFSLWDHRYVPCTNFSILSTVLEPQSSTRNLQSSTSESK